MQTLPFTAGMRKCFGLFDHCMARSPCASKAKKTSPCNVTDKNMAAQEPRGVLSGWYLSHASLSGVKLPSKSFTAEERKLAESAGVRRGAGCKSLKSLWVPEWGTSLTNYAGTGGSEALSKPGNVTPKQAWADGWMGRCTELEVGVGRGWERGWRASKQGWKKDQNILLKLRLYWRVTENVVKVTE